MTRVRQAQENLLVMFHCQARAGYAISRLESVFLDAAKLAVGEASETFFSFNSPVDARYSVGEKFVSAFELRSRGSEADVMAAYADIAERRISTVLAFDLQPHSRICAVLRRAGVKRIVSYWGASISAPHSFWSRSLRRVRFLLDANRPDCFVFESEGMRNLAIIGSGIPERYCSVCRIGVDLSEFHPRLDRSTYAYEQFDIPRDRHIVMFTGHFEQRKGLGVLMEAMVELVDRRGRSDVHLLALGNAPGQESIYRQILSGTQAYGNVTFGGYRLDVPLLHTSTYLGVLPSTGWDSFTVSAAEMAASGIPLVVSDLVGLREAVIPDETGLLFTVGDSRALADRVEYLLDRRQTRDRMAEASRARACAEFSRQRQVSSLATLIRPN